MLGNRDDEDYPTTPYDVAIIGDYNIGGDAWSSRILLEEIGLRVVAQWSGDGTLAEMERTTKVKLNLVHCYRSMNYISRFMEEKYQIPWMEYNFFGPSKTEESLRAIAARFDETIQAKAEEVIARYRAQWQPVIDKYKPRLAGKKVMLYVGGLRPRHVIGAYEDLGMEVIGAGYEFAHSSSKDSHPKTVAVVYPTPAVKKCGGSSRNLRPCAVLRGFSRYVAVLPGGFPASAHTKRRGMPGDLWD